MRGRFLSVWLATFACNKSIYITAMYYFSQHHAGLLPCWADLDPSHWYLGTYVDCQKRGDRHHFYHNNLPSTNPVGQLHCTVLPSVPVSHGCLLFRSRYFKPNVFNIFRTMLTQGLLKWSRDRDENEHVLLANCFNNRHGSVVTASKWCTVADVFSSRRCPTRICYCFINIYLPWGGKTYSISLPGGSPVVSFSNLSTVCDDLLAPRMNHCSNQRCREYLQFELNHVEGITVGSVLVFSVCTCHALIFEWWEYDTILQVEYLIEYAGYPSLINQLLFRDTWHNFSLCVSMHHQLHFWLLLNWIL